MSHMVERVAKAILAEVPEGNMTAIEARKYARAAIEAMRGPNEKMLIAGISEAPIAAASSVRTIWSAMIDAALAWHARA